ncbi:hypothetical protein QE400_000063 [Xanthomonas sacchari]|uniref:hypothetical protein n=1 Tax=Xanthomonas sacchari TaxID=56458 RepID=UPI00278374EE|nr:hypothetical protein [Xanthomonas sacchari]MDQ1090650.1 hypothetical protein [Xanthomonas sacchari]
MKLPVHQADVYNIDMELRDGWHCVGNRGDRNDALAMAGRQAALTGTRYRVCAPGGTVIYDSATNKTDGLDLASRHVRALADLRTIVSLDSNYPGDHVAALAALDYSIAMLDASGKHDDPN